MAPPATPQIDYEQELKIVRKFMRRNNIDDLMLALSPWGSPYQAVRVVGYAGEIPNEHPSRHQGWIHRGYRPAVDSFRLPKQTA